MKYFLLLFTFISAFSKVTVYGKNHAPIKIDTATVYQATVNSDSVNTGYHYVSRNQVTGAISTITEKQLQQGATFSVDQALKGKAAGVQVTQNSGMPGAAASVRVRGVATLYNSAEPLYVLDGVPLTPTDPGSTNQFLSILDFLNLNDISSVEILKDAGAAAIYGSRATNGVVLLTTKRGQAKANQVTYHSYVGLQQVPKQILLLNAPEYAGLVNEALQQYGHKPRYTSNQIQALGQGTNWQAELYRLAPIHQQQVNYTGGSVAHRVYAGVGYLNQQEIVIQSGLQRYNFRLNYDGQIGKKLKAGASSFVSTIKNRPSEADIITYTLLAPPIWKIDEYDPLLRNPLKIIKENTRSETSKLLWSNVFGEYQFLPGLFLKLHYGISDTQQENRYSEGVSYFRQGFTKSTASFGSRTTLKEATLHYRKTWRKHFLSLVSGSALQLTDTETAAENSFSEDGKAFWMAGGREDRTAQKWVSYFGRLQYNFADRYFLSASVRKDGSSQFTWPEKYTLSPALAVAWQVLGLTRTERVPSLKLRASYGQTAHAYKPTNIYSANVFVRRHPTPPITGYPTYNPGDSPTIGYRPRIIPPDLVAEKTRQVNLGVDISMLSDRLELTADLYQRQTADVIAILPIGPRNASSYYLSNSAAIRNQGLEISMHTTNLKGLVTWHTAFTFATNQNKITELKEYAGILNNNIFYITEGKSVTSFYGYKTDGLYQNQSEINNGQSLGNLKYRDLNGNGEVYDDPAIIGNAQPKFIYSLNNTVSFKDLEVDFLLQGVQGNDIYNSNRALLDNFHLGERYIPLNSSRETLNHWTASQTNTDMPRLNGYGYNRQPSDFYVENGSFLRIRNLTVAYNLPQKLTLRNKIVQAKVYISGQNLFTFTKYSGYDPELGGQQPIEQGWDSFNYPIPRTYLAGLKITW